LCIVESLRESPCIHSHVESFDEERSRRETTLFDEERNRREITLVD